MSVKESNDIDLNNFSLRLGNMQVSDGQYTVVAEKYFKAAKLMQNTLDDYVGELYSLSEILSGKFADNLGTFAKNIELLCGNCYVEMIENLQSYMNDYIEKLDSADGKMF